MPLFANSSHFCKSALPIVLFPKKSNMSSFVTFLSPVVPSVLGEVLLTLEASAIKPFIAATFEAISVCPSKNICWYFFWKSSLLNSPFSSASFTNLSNSASSSLDGCSTELAVGLETVFSTVDSSACSCGASGTAGSSVVSCISAAAASGFFSPFSSYFPISSFNASRACFKPFASPASCAASNWFAILLKFARNSSLLPRSDLWTVLSTKSAHSFSMSSSTVCHFSPFAAFFSKPGAVSPTTSCFLCSLIAFFVLESIWSALVSFFGGLSACRMSISNSWVCLCFPTRFQSSVDDVIPGFWVRYICTIFSTIFFLEGGQPTVRRNVNLFLEFLSFVTCTTQPGPTVALMAVLMSASSSLGPWKRQKSGFFARHCAKVVWQLALVGAFFGPASIAILE